MQLRPIILSVSLGVGLKGVWACKNKGFWRTSINVDKKMTRTKCHMFLYKFILMGITIKI